MTLAAGENNLTIDAGVYVPAAATPTQTRTSTPISFAPTATATRTRTTSPTLPFGIVTPTITSSLPTAQPSATQTPFIDVALVQTNTGNFRTCAIGVYQLTVRNMGTGSRSATSGPLTVTDALPSGLTFVSGAGVGWTCSAAGQSVTCVYPAILPPNATTIVELSVLVDPSAYPTINNVAFVSTPNDVNPENDIDADQTTVYAGDCSTGVPTPTPTPFLDISLTQSNTANFRTCEVGVYDLTVLNMGTGSRVSTIGPITITDALPTGLTFVSGSGDGWVCSAESGQFVTCTYSSALAPDEATVVHLSVLVGEEAYPSINSVAYVSTPSDANPGNNIGQDATTVYRGNCTGGQPTPSPTATRTPGITTGVLPMTASHVVRAGRSAQIAIKLRRLAGPITVQLQLPAELKATVLAPQATVSPTGLVTWVVGTAGGSLTTTSLKLKALAATTSTVPINVGVSALATGPTYSGSASATISIKP